MQKSGNFPKYHFYSIFCERRLCTLQPFVLRSKPQLKDSSVCRGLGSDRDMFGCIHVVWAALSLLAAVLPTCESLHCEEGTLVGECVCGMDTGVTQSNNLSLCLHNVSTDLPVHLPASMFSSGVKAIRISQVHIASISADWLAGCPSLTSLSITGAGLTEVPADMFIHAQHVTSIDLSDNLLTGLPEHVFRGLTGLTTLVLRTNLLQAVNLDPVCNHLDHLDLSQNQFWSFDLGEHSLLRVLRTLNMSLNLISGGQLSRQHLFIASPRLTKLDLSHNKIAGTLREDILELNKNASIDLSNNQIDRIDHTKDNFTAHFGHFLVSPLFHQVIVNLSSNMQRQSLTYSIGRYFF